MKKIIAASLIALTLTGCATGPSVGHYYTDENGVQQYEPSAEAKNKDTWATTGIVAGVITGIAALTLGIVAVTK